MGAVWGQMATGGGQRSLNEFMASINVPGMSKPTFNRIETQIGMQWKKILSDEMISAGVEEKKLAIERNDCFQGVPAITVSGWSKRSHKHSYNAKSGVALIIGKETNYIWGSETSFVLFVQLHITKTYHLKTMFATRTGQDRPVRWK